MQPKPLNRVEVTHRRLMDPGVLWLVSNGYVFNLIGKRVYLERHASR